MTNFNELFEQAEQIADRRKAIFNQLIEKTVSEILPKFCGTMKKLEISYEKLHRRHAMAIPC